MLSFAEVYNGLGYYNMDKVSPYISIKNEFKLLFSTKLECTVSSSFLLHALSATTI